jgi:hypothetical protein
MLLIRLPAQVLSIWRLLIAPGKLGLLTLTPAAMQRKAPRESDEGMKAQIAMEDIQWNPKGPGNACPHWMDQRGRLQAGEKGIWHSPCSENMEMASQAGD